MSTRGSVCSWLLLFCSAAAVCAKPIVIVDGVPIDEKIIDRKMKAYAGRLTKKEYIRKRAEYVAETIKLYLKRRFAEEKLGHIKVSGREVEESIAEIKRQMARDPALRGLTFEEILAFQGITPEELRRRQRNNIRYLKYLRSLVTEEMCRKAYEAHKEFFDGTAVKASVIFIPLDEEDETRTRERAEKLAARLKKNPSPEAFAAAARAFSAHPSAAEGGDVGFFTRFERILPEAAAAAAFAMKTGEIRGPVSTPMGYYIVMVTDRKKGTRTSYKECRDTVYAWLVYREEARVVAELIKKAKIVFPGMKKEGEKRKEEGKEAPSTGAPLSPGTPR